MKKSDFLKNKSMLLEKKIGYLKALSEISDRMAALTNNPGKGALRAIGPVLEERKKIIAEIDMIDTEIKNLPGPDQTTDGLSGDAPELSKILEDEGHISLMLEHIRNNHSLVFSFFKDKREEIKKELLTLQEAKKSIPAYLQVPRKKGSIINKTDKK